MFRKNLNYLFVLLAVGIITISGCKKDDEVNVMTDAEFMNFAAVSGLFEIQSSQLAPERASTPQVVDYALHMINDHTTQDQELKALASQKNIALPTALTPEKQTIVARLGTLNGANFDKEYMNAQVQSHEETVANFEKASMDARDADIKAFAAKYLPALRMHLEEARGIKTTTDAL
jgi:putative membrane protein